MSWQGKEAIRLAGPLIGGKARPVREAVIMKLASQGQHDPFPTLSTLARATGFTERQVQRAVAFWRRTGLLQVFHQGGAKPSVYVLLSGTGGPSPSPRKIARDQSRAARLARLAAGYCPIHWIGMSQVGNEPEPSPWSIVACNCGIHGRQRDEAIELLPPWQHLLDGEARP